MNDTKQSTQSVRLTILVHRHEGLSEAEFHEHATTVHIKIVKDWLLRHGITGYSHYYSTARTRALLSSELPSFNSNIENQAEYDVFIELRMPSLSCFENALRDPYYKEFVAPDEALMGDLRSAKITAGWEEVHIVDGKFVGNSPS